MTASSLSGELLTFSRLNVHIYTYTTASGFASSQKLRQINCGHRNRSLVIKYHYELRLIASHMSAESA